MKNSVLPSHCLASQQGQQGQHFACLAPQQGQQAAPTAALLGVGRAHLVPPCLPQGGDMPLARLSSEAGGPASAPEAPEALAVLLLVQLAQQA